VNQRRRWEGVIAAFLGHAGASQAAQFVVHDREQLFGGLPVALADSVKQLRDFGHKLHDSRMF
jgi:hypothetical protein